MTDRILLAEIIGAHGIRGEVRARVFAEHLDNLMRYGPLSDRTGTRVFAVTSARPGAHGTILRLEGVADRTQAEALRGVELFVERSALPAPEDGAFYHADLVGLRALAPDGAGIGTVVAVRNFGAGDLIEIAPPGDAETLLVPFRDAFVPEVDVAGGTMTVIVPDMVGEPEPGEKRTGDAGDDDE